MHTPDLTSFRVWAPASRSVSVQLLDESGRVEADRLECAAQAGGYFFGSGRAPAGTRYWIELDDGARYADPASRFQPDGPHGASEVIDATFAWEDGEWRGITDRAPVVYELHVGTFTTEGTWARAAQELPRLADLGVSVLEIMPLSEFPGRFGWGYDGVLPFAPSHLYGRPDDVRRFINRAHLLGVGVILDVVYNHFGPDGCMLTRFSPDYFAKAETEWGQAINFDGPRAEFVREFFIANAGYWIEDFHFDGLRLDALNAIADRSPEHIISAVAKEVRRRGGSRRTWIVAEHEQQDAAWVRPDESGHAILDAVWNDDFHHSAGVALTGRREAYYTDYLGTPQEFISAARHGFLYQGQWYSWQGKRRGTPTTGVPAQAFVCCLEDHDQVGNSSAGLRMHQLTSPGRMRAMTALLLLGPWSPMLFQGQEFASSAPFLYFADHQGELAAAVRRGRREFLAQFPSLASTGAAERLTNPSDPDTFLACKLDGGDETAHPEAVALHRSLLALRRADPAFGGRTAYTVDGAVLGDGVFVLRFTTPEARDVDARRADRLLVVNLGAEHRVAFFAEPLMSPVPADRWRVVWSSEDPSYGGSGIPALDESAWRIPAESALVLAPESGR